MNNHIIELHPDFKTKTLTIKGHHDVTTYDITQLRAYVKKLQAILQSMEDLG